MCIRDRDNILFADQNNSDNKIIVPVNVTIPAPAVSNVTRDPKDGPDFGTLVDGYTELPASQTITLTNEGNADAVLSDAVSSTGAVSYTHLVSDEEIRTYIASGEPMDKAGSYGIQGGFGIYVKEIRGEYTNVVGLPVGRLFYEMKKHGIELRG